MKTIIFFLAAFAFQFVSNNCTGQTEPVLSLVTTINLKGAEHLYFKAEGQVEIVYWDLDHAKVEVFVDEPYFNRAQLKALIPMGIFRITSYIQGDTAIVDAPGQDNPATINGKRISTAMRFRVTLPHYTSFAQAETIMVAETKTPNTEN